MSKNSTPIIACALCVGAARELYLPATLASIAGAVDLLVVNDNSGLARSDNVAALEASAFAARGALRIERHPFVDFADMRNKAFAPLRALERPPDWVMFLDADEVHGEQVRSLAREVLPRLGAEVGELDAYTYHFFGTFGWITDVARRMAFYRYSPGIAWNNRVHEKIEGVPGRAVVVPYIYHHYGNVVPPSVLARKHMRYYELGNPVPRPVDAGRATREVYLNNAAAVRPFRGKHPRVARPLLAELEGLYAEEFALIDGGFRERRGRAVRAAASLRALNEALRVRLRRLEHPLLY
ncbi:MAG: hypothetical protein WAJ85_08345, partial [Candidatus Baltobacteraceae bacterium]